MTLLNTICTRLQQDAGQASGQELDPRRGTIRRTMPAIPENYVSGLVAAQDRTPDTSRTGGSGDGFMHVSSLIGACSREHALAATLQTQAGVRPMTPDHRLMFALGRACESHIRRQFITAVNRVGVFGQWWCVCGATRHVGMAPANPDRCPVCGTFPTLYRENPVFEDEDRVVGNPDLAFQLGGYLVVTELKSMNGDEWDRLDAARANHIIQAVMYRHLLDRANFAVHDQVVIVYANKHFRFFRGRDGEHPSPYKEYHVDATAPDQVNMVEDCLRIARAVRDSRNGGDLPPRLRACQEPTSTRARGCSQVARCFNMPG